MNTIRTGKREDNCKLMAGKPIMGDAIRACLPESFVMNWLYRKPVPCKSAAELPSILCGHVIYDLSEMEISSSHAPLILQCKTGTDLTLIGRPKQILKSLTLHLHGYCVLHLTNIHIENAAAPVIYLHGRDNRIRYSGCNRLCGPEDAAALIAEARADFSIAPEKGDSEGSIAITGVSLRHDEEG